MIRAKSNKLGGNSDANRRTRLEDLPDAILMLHILSKLPAKDAVRTSALSKRWEHLWTYINVLKFDQDQFSGNSVFMNFVDEVLLLHDQSSMNEFHLSCDPFPYTYRINAWISTAIRRNAEVLKLCLRGFQPLSKYMLPHCLFKSQSLKTFHLDMPCDLKLPSSLYFRSLEELSLSQVRFIDVGSTHNLLSSPALERLCISRCQWKISSGSFSAPKLQSLSIDESNEEASSEPEIAIISSSLKFFSYAGLFLTGFSIYGSPHLVEAKIHSIIEYDYNLQAYRLVKMLKGLQCVKVLTLSSTCFQILMRKDELLRYLPEFGNITNLDLGFDTLGWGISWRDRTFLEILKKCPHLTTLKLNKANLFPEDPEDSDDDISCLRRMFTRMPPCFESHLKKITIRNCSFYLSEDELSSMSLFLKTAKVLEEMVIYCSRTNKEDLVKKKEILKRLQELPKGSKHCKVSLI